jgi:predicted RNase H-like HicB family nuclease
MSTGKEGAREILLRPYSRVLIPDHDTKTYAAFILEFPGCVAQGDTPEAAYRSLEAAAESWIEAARDLGQEVPRPFSEERYSGRVLLRLPRSLHQRAAEMARRDHVSLNQFIVAAVAERLGAAKTRANIGIRHLDDAEVLAVEVREADPGDSAIRSPVDQLGPARKR